jgi:hypothetical protein
VCWDTPGDDEAKALVRDSVVGSWGTAAALDFVGWERCSSDGADLRVTFADENPRVQDFGNRLKGMRGGILLNATFVQWGSDCQTSWHACVIAGAIHEFGHALGFLHEQDRADAPGECGLLTDTPTADSTVLGAYDAMSIMNYCNPEFFTRPHLSDGDVEGVRRVYGARATTDVSDRCSFSNDFEGARCASGLGDSDQKTLLVCSGNRTVSSRVCANGCRWNPPGEADECNPTDEPVDLCAHSNGFNGFICASSLGEDPTSKKLVRCIGNETVSTRTCEHGCMRDTPTIPDECLHSNRCAFMNVSDGDVCGSVYSEWRVLYSCRNGETVSATVCENGCVDGECR